jgi:hypothetical protein
VRRADLTTQGEEAETLQRRRHEHARGARSRLTGIQPLPIAVVTPRELVREVREARFAGNTHGIALEPPSELGVGEQLLEKESVVSRHL